MAEYNSFIFISLQGWFIHKLSNMPLSKNISLDGIENILFDFALATVVCLGFMFSHINKYSLDVKFIFFFMGAMQIGILITISSLDFISIQMKIWSNTLYVLLPAYVLYEIEKNRNIQQKEKK
ncbi:hypothetical protein [Glaesserella australis]|uniref:hypothetical protein n=1 Tax=Glaesserella australis TaxID=2094024 RepID=UPI001CA4BAE7|nr:hypothetical protein [Glaesserella australis]